MPAKNHDLHGNAPDSSEAALLLIDVINDLEFPGGRKLLQPALRAAKRIAALKREARAAGVPVIYANDNFGRWRSNFGDVVAHCLNDGVVGEPIVRLLAPDDDDYFVLKPKHSAFFATTLETLLSYLQTKRVVLTGFAGDACVLMTAVDAYMRDVELYVPSDCIASKSPTDNQAALQYMRRVLHAETTVSSRIDLRKLGGAASANTRKKS